MAKFLHTFPVFPQCGAVAAALALLLSPLIGSVAARAGDVGADLQDLRLDQVQILGSHNSYRPYPSPRSEARILKLDPKIWPELAYGHPPLEAQLALGLRQLELDVAPDPQGGLYSAPYEQDAPVDVIKEMWTPGAKVLHVPMLDYASHCLTFRRCLGILARWSDAHPRHFPVIVLVNAGDFTPIYGLWNHTAKFDAASLADLDRDILSVIGRGRLFTPDDLRGTHASLREAAMAHAWPTVRALNGKFMFVLDGNDSHMKLYKAGHASLRGRAMFGWYDEASPEASIFNIQDPGADEAQVRRLVAEGFLVRTRGNDGTKEARENDRRRFDTAVRLGSQIISTDYYDGAPNPEGFPLILDFQGATLAADPVTAPR